MEYKYKFNFTQIVDDMGDLKPLGVYYCNTLPQQGDQIAMVASDDNGNPIQRLYFTVHHIVHFSNVGDGNNFYQTANILGELQCELLVDEPIDWRN